MEEKVIKDAYKEAEKDLEKDKINKFKDIIKKTLEKLESKQKEHQKIVKEIQILKKDVKDFSEGRLDRIEERQRVDPEAKKVSVIIIKKGAMVDENGKKFIDHTYHWIDSRTSCSGYCTNAFVVTNTSGTYKLNSGSIKYL